MVGQASTSSFVVDRVPAPLNSLVLVVFAGLGQLLRMGNTQSSAGLPLHLADHGKELLKCAERGDTNIVTLIVGCNPQALSHSSVFGGNTVWHKAAKTGKVAVFEAMELVLQQAYEISSKDLSSSRVGLRRLGDSSSDVIKRVINKANMKGITPLMLACAGSHTEAVAWLLKHGKLCLRFGYKLCLGFGKLCLRFGTVHRRRSSCCVAAMWIAAVAGGSQRMRPCQAARRLRLASAGCTPLLFGHRSAYAHHRAEVAQQSSLQRLALQVSHVCYFLYRCCRC